MAIPAQLIYGSMAVVCAGIAAVHDLKARRIPNRLTGPAILFGLLLHLGLGGFAQLGSALLAGLIAGGIFLVFYVAGGMGAGDVKLMAAIGCIAGLASVKDVLVATVIVGAVFAVAVATYRGKLRESLSNVFTLLGHHQSNGLKAHPELNVSNDATLRLPYALPIAVGCLVALYMKTSGGVSL